MSEPFDVRDEATLAVLAVLEKTRKQVIAKRPEPVCGYCQQPLSRCQGTQMCDDYWNAKLWEEGGDERN